MKIKIGPMTFDLARLTEYNPNYLPQKAFATFGEIEVTLTGEAGANFDKCVSVYLDYVLGSRPDSEDEINRRMKEVLPFMAL